MFVGDGWCEPSLVANFHTAAWHLSSRRNQLLPASSTLHQVTLHFDSCLFLFLFFIFWHLSCTAILLLLFVEETVHIPWYQTFTSWCSNQTLLYFVQLKLNFFVWQDCGEWEELGYSWLKKKSIFCLYLTAIHMLRVTCASACVQTNTYLPFLHKSESCVIALRQCGRQRESPLFAVWSQWSYRS